MDQVVQIKGLYVRKDLEHGRVPDLGFAKRIEFKPDDVVLDLGAHIGTFSVFAAKQTQQVFAVEPEPSNAQMWRMNCIELQNTALYEAAVALEDGHTELWLSPKGSSFTHHTVKKPRSDEYIVVRTVALRSLPKCTVWKMDIEGAEYDLRFWEHLQGVRVLALDLHNIRPRNFDEDISMVSSELRNIGMREQFQHTWTGYRGLWTT